MFSTWTGGYSFENFLLIDRVERLVNQLYLNFVLELHSLLSLESYGSLKSPSILLPFAPPSDCYFQPFEMLEVGKWLCYLGFHFLNDIFLLFLLDR